ncbi:MAG: ATP-dependent Clp protease adaptor ClpS [Bacteroidetes bacterium]|nr:ATP-dependent Clp protease adaptor ClpS [Bacteroidota bacterium]
MTREKTSPREQSGDDLGHEYQLILYNDDHNSFDHVIRSLVEVCGHDEIQAEQCAVITHFRGKCDIRRGSRRLLSRMRMSLQKRDLTVEIE